MTVVTEKTNQEIVNLAIIIFEHISKNEISLARVEIEKLTSVETLKVIAVASPHYADEMVKLLVNAKYYW